MAETRLPVRFWRNIDEASDGCWLWCGTTNGKGYGLIRLGPEHRWALTHRAIYEDQVATIPPGWEIDHLCRVRLCCNPAHLEAVTHRENQRRGDGPPGVNARKTHCVHGHPIDGIRGNGKRYCMTCNRLQNQRWRLQNQRRRA